MPAFPARALLSCLLFPMSCGPGWAAGASQAPPAKATHTDLYGDPLPPDALVRLGTVRLSAASGECLAYSPDGKILAVGAGDTIRMFDPVSGKELCRLPGHRKSVFAVAFSPDGKTLASAGEDGTLRLWDVFAGKEIRQGSCAVSSLHQHWHQYWRFRPLTFSSDGKSLSLFLFSTFFWREARFWDGGTAKPMSAPEGPLRGLQIEALSPDGRTVVATSGENRIIWDRMSGKLRGHVPVAGQCDPVVLSPDARILALVRKDAQTLRRGPGILQLWEVASGKQLGRCEGHSKIIFALAFSPDGKSLASAGHDEKVRLWNSATGRLVWQYQGRGGSGVRALTFSPDGKDLAVIGWGGTLRLLDPTTGTERDPGRPHPRGLGSVDFTPDGKRLVTVGYDQSLRLWDTATGRQLLCLREPALWPDDDGFTSPPGGFFSVACASDGQMVALAEVRGLSLWDLGAPGKPRIVHGGAYCVAFSPNAKILASCGREIDLWDVQTGKKLRQLQEVRDTGTHAPSAHALSFSPDGKLLATGGQDHLIRLWHAATGMQVGKANAGTMIRALDFSPDGRTLVTSGDDDQLRLWEVAALQERANIPRRSLPYFQRAPFSADGRYIALSGTGGIHVYHALTGADIHQHKLEGGVPIVRRFSPDGRTLVMAGPGVLLMDAGRIMPTTPPSVAAITTKEFKALWSRLAERDAAQAAQALATLSANPQQAVAFLGGVLPPARPPARTIADLIRDLDDKNFAVRENATHGLAKLGRDAEPLLREAQRNPASEEVRRRLDRLVDRLKDHVLSADTLRHIRAVELLERINNPEARALLRTLAQGAPDARLTHEARTTLARLHSRTKNP